VTRLKQAVERASAAAAAKKEAEMLKMQTTNNSTSSTSTSSGSNTFHYELPTVPDPLYGDGGDQSYEILPTRPSLPAVPKERTMLELMAYIDRQLEESVTISRQQMNAWQQPSSFMYQGRVDSLMALMVHNDRVRHAKPSSSLTPIPGAPPPRLVLRQVALVCCKPLIQNQISIEQEYRIQRLVQAMRTKEFVPYMVVFVGSDSATKAMEYFQQVLLVQQQHQQDGDGDADEKTPQQQQQQHHLPKCMAESTPILDGGLDMVTKYFQADLARWSRKLLEKLHEDTTTMTTTTNGGVAGGGHMRRVVVQIQFALVSADYHLCILNDLHIRSPMQSFLKCFDYHHNHWDNIIEDRHRPSFAPKRIVIEPSWLYLYASTTGLRYYYPHHNNNENDEEDRDRQEEQNIAISFCATCYRRVHLLIPVLMNIKAVTQNREFFQRDNYRLLVQIRRALITDVEGLYHGDEYGDGGGDTQTLNAVRKYRTSQLNLNGTYKTLDVVLDGALLSMGRCSDLVRPAGLLTGSVPITDFRRAVTFLEHAISQITMACDPDRPFVPSSAHQRSAAKATTSTTAATAVSSKATLSSFLADDEDDDDDHHHHRPEILDEPRDSSSAIVPGTTRIPRKTSLPRRQRRRKRKAVLLPTEQHV
jgi:hypothetical protein